MEILEQNTMRFNPRRIRVQSLEGIFRGKIVPNGVRYADGTKIKQSLVDVYIYDLDMTIPGIPLLSGKINKSDGEEWTPEADDLVAVMFFGQRVDDPIIVGYIPPADNGIQTPAAEAPRYFRKRSGTWEKIQKDGTRRVYVAASDFLDVVTDLTVTVLNGLTKFISKGKTLIQSEGTVEVDGIGTGAVKGIVQGDSIDVFTGKPHAHISASVKGSA